MPDTLLPGPTSPPSWIGDLTRVPFWVYRDGSLQKVEQERIFEGPVWNYLCLEDERVLSRDPECRPSRVRPAAGSWSRVRALLIEQKTPKTQEIRQIWPGGLFGYG